MYLDLVAALRVLAEGGAPASAWRDARAMLEAMGFRSADEALNSCLIRWAAIAATTDRSMPGFRHDPETWRKASVPSSLRNL